MQRLVQMLLDRADDQAANGRGVTKAHFGFRRVDVDVDLRRIAPDEERCDRMPVRGQEVEIGASESAGERLSRTVRPSTNRNCSDAFGRL